jgi:hypothetical protein
MCPSRLLFPRGALQMQLTMVGFGTAEGTTFEAVQQYTLEVCTGMRCATISPSESSQFTQYV